MEVSKNEKGYSLLLVMMLILLFTVLGMGLLTMNINAAKQFNLKEGQVQSRHQAEMGVLHYQAVLKDKIAQSSSEVLSCNDIEQLLGTNKQIDEGMYSVTGANASGTSCEKIDNGNKFEIRIKSLGKANSNTQKEITATFYAENRGTADVEIITPPAVPKEPENQGNIILNLVLTCKNNGILCLNPTDIREYAKLELLDMQKNFLHFYNHLVVKTVDIKGGSQDILKVDNDLYVSDKLKIQNHACIGVGGNFTVKTQLDLTTQTTFIIRRDAYLPAEILNSNLNKSNIYIYRDLYIPYSFSRIENINVFVNGSVYKQSAAGVYQKINKETYNIKGFNEMEIGDASCKVDEATGPEYDNSPGSPLWGLMDEANITYN